jgi:hypothetical protein
LFVCVIGRTSRARKGTAFAYVESMLGKVDPSWHANRIIRGVSSGEGLVSAVRDGNESQPGVNDKRLFDLETEFGGTLRIMGRSGNSMSKITRQAWDGTTLETATKKCPLRATNTHISVVGHVTLEEFWAYLPHTEMFSGFANRFLYVCANRSKLLPRGGNVSHKELSALTVQLQSAVNFAGGVGRVEFSPNAGSFWDEQYPVLTTELPGLVGVATSRAEAQVLRIALIYALMDKSAQIRKKHLQAALGVWRYCLDSAQFIFDRSRVVTPELKLEERILDLLRKSATNGVTRTEISAALNNHYDANAIGAALSELREDGIAYSQKEKTGGRAAERWFAVGKGERVITT